MVTRYDFIALKASVDETTGWIRDRPVITRTGIFEYQTIDGKVRKEFRPDAEVFDSNSLASIAGIPITDSHIGILNIRNHKGVIGTVLSPGIKEDSNVIADIIIHDANKLGKRRDLSLGYTCSLDETPGQTDNGERYDAIQKAIRYNHLAVVHSGRAGNARLRLDATDAVHGMFDQENDDMSEKERLMTTVRLDNLDYPAAPEVANRLTKYESDLAELKKNYDAIEAERDSFKASLEEEKEKTAKATNAAIAAARARIKLEDIASKAGVSFDDSTSIRQIKESVVNKLRANTFKFDGKSDDYVDSAFDLIVTEQSSRDDNTADQRKKLKEPRQDDNTDKNSSSSARERMIARIRGQKQEAA